MINTKLYVDILSRQAKKDGRPHEMALSDFCDFLLDLFSVEAFKGKGADSLKTGSMNVSAKSLISGCWLLTGW